MLKFKQFLEERRRATPEVRAWLDTRSKPYEYWLSRKFRVPFPISKPMMTRMGNTEENVEGIHITDDAGLRTIFNLQNSSKSISVMTFIDDVDMGMELLDGIETAGGVVVEVVGDVPFKGDFDIFTSPDNQGRRWLDLNQFIFNKFENAPNFFHNWQLIYIETIEDHTRNFLTKRMADYINFKLDYPVDRSTVLRVLEEMKIFWTGSQNRKITGRSNEDALLDLGIVRNLQNKMEVMEKDLSRQDIKSYQTIIKEAKMTLFKMTKDLFDKAEDYFSDNILEFYTMASMEGKTTLGNSGPAYDEAVMDNFKVVDVYYRTKTYMESDIEFAVDGRIEPIPMIDLDFKTYFKKWARN